MAFIEKCSGSDGSQDIFNNEKRLALFNKLGAIFQTRDRRNGATSSQGNFHIVVKNDRLQKLQAALLCDAQDIRIVKRRNIADASDKVQKSGVVV